MILAQKQSGRPIERIEDLEIKPHIYSCLIFYEGSKTYLGEKTSSSTNGTGKIEYSHV
jgi:hypothetical protein